MCTPNDFWISTQKQLGLGILSVNKVRLHWSKLPVPKAANTIINPLCLVSAFWNSTYLWFTWLTKQALRNVYRLCGYFATAVGAVKRKSRKYLWLNSSWALDEGNQEETGCLVRVRDRDIFLLNEIIDKGSRWIYHDLPFLSMFCLCIGFWTCRYSNTVLYPVCWIVCLKPLFT